MNKKAYLLTFDRDPSKDYLEFHKKLTTMPEISNWFHYIQSSYIIISDAQRAYTLSTKIKDIIPNNRFLLIEVKIGNENGLLPEAGWAWLKRNLS